MSAKISEDGRQEPLLKQQQGSDHVVTKSHHLSLHRYPKDCPPMRPCWFHAVDIPKRRPFPVAHNKAEAKPAGTPKKYAAFSIHDSKVIEAAFQRLVEEEELSELSAKEGEHRHGTASGADVDKDLKPGKVQVPVNEDYLFDVDVERRELSPAYWLGPIYDVRRGTWFYQDGNVQRPCDENLAAQLEEGYLKAKAWTLSKPNTVTRSQRSSSQPRTRPVSWSASSAKVEEAGQNQPTHDPTSGDIRSRTPDQSEITTAQPPQTTHRLFGAHMNSIVTYQDAETAWLLTDDFLSRMNYSVYQRFAGGGHFAGVKLTRGYINPDKKTTEQVDSVATSQESSESKTVKVDDVQPSTNKDESAQIPAETRRQSLVRQMSALLDDVHENPEQQEKERQRRDEREIKHDYQEVEGDEQGRQIEHLILVTHGIGQRLGLRLESINFVHDVNAFRKTLKTVYANSPDLRALNAELGNAESLNSRVQVLPICWRHLLDFPKRSLRQKRKEHDIVDPDFDETDLPSLDDITVEGVPAVRNLITDLALDILLYQSDVYKKHISGIVLSECNRIYRLFKERNPDFRGKVSMIGHSLGSAIMFDILCKQDNKPIQAHPRHEQKHHMALDFEVNDFYALGSPIGLFQMLKGQTIAARERSGAHARVPLAGDDPMLDGPATAARHKSHRRSESSITTNDAAISQPKCAQIFNIFHPTDPIAYRVEPMISSAMATLKPQPLPYTKRGIFGAPISQGLTGIGTRVSQSVSSMWSSVASNLLTRGLGYANDTDHKVGGSQAKQKGPLSLVPEAPSGTSNQMSSEDPSSKDRPNAIPVEQDIAQNQHSQHPPTLIDAELETLYAGFQKQRKSVQNDAALRDLGSESVQSYEIEERAKKLRREEEKVRLLNSNGRVDYAIQEGAFDINLIAAVASHLSYWTDEDVGHFITSQLLSRNRVVDVQKPSTTAL